MALEWVSGADVWCNRCCKTNPVDLEGSRGQVFGVLAGFWWVCLQWAYRKVSVDRNTATETQTLK